MKIKKGSWLYNRLLDICKPSTTVAVLEPFFHLFGYRNGLQSRNLLQAKKILVIRPDTIGDVILSTAFFRELRYNFTEARITLLVRAQSYNAVELCPYVDEIKTYDDALMANRHQITIHLKIFKFCFNSLWNRHFDLCIMPRYGTDWFQAAYIGYFSGSKFRLAYTEGTSPKKMKLNKYYDRLLTHVISLKEQNHEVLNNLSIIKYIGGKIKNEKLEFWLSNDDLNFAEKTLNVNGLKSDDVMIGFSPGAGHNKRVWPTRNFVELGGWLKKTLNARILIVGDNCDAPMGRQIARALGESVIDCTGKTTIRQTAALLERCNLVVTNDSGPMHISAAMGTSVVEISCHPVGSSKLHFNAPERFGPWRVRSIVLQPEQPVPPCTDGCMQAESHCIRKVSIKDVKGAVVALLKKG